MGGGRMLVTTFSHDSSNYVTNQRDGWVCWQREVGKAETERIFSLYYQRWGKDKKTSLVRTLWRFK